MEEKEHANKCESEFENPIDNFLCSTLPYVRPYFHNLGFSANGITYLSIMFGFGRQPMSKLHKVRRNILKPL